MSMVRKAAKKHAEDEYNEDKYPAHFVRRQQSAKGRVHARQKSAKKAVYFSV